MRKGSELRKEQGREREEGNEKREFEKKLGTCLLVQILYQPPISVVSTRFVPTSKEIGTIVEAQFRKTLCHAVTLLSAQNTQICNYVTDHVKYFCSVNPLETQKFVTVCNRPREIFLFSSLIYPGSIKVLKPGNLD